MSNPIPPVPATGAAKEPLLTVGGLGTIASAVITALVAWQVPLTADQRLAIVGLVAVLGPFIVALVGRLHVWSPRSVRLLALQIQADARPTPRKAAPYIAVTDTPPDSAA